MKDLRQTIESKYQPIFDDFILTRAATLYEWCGMQTQQGVCGIRNDCVHGGNVVADIETIRQYSNPMNRGTEWKTAFLNKYGVTFSNVQDSTLEHDLIATMNKSTTVACTKPWANSKNASARQRIISNADEILEAWLKGKKHLFQENSRTGKFHSEIQALYGSCQF